MKRAPHERVRYGTRLARGYEAGRQLAPTTERLWIEAVRRHAGAAAMERLLDLGSGTGRFSRPFARHLGVEVVGVEPSAAMRSVAEAAPAHELVRYVAGDASAIPLPDGSCDIAWLSMVVHHLPNLRAAARELERVVRPGGIVFVRNSFRGRLDGVCFYRFFPRARAADEARHPRVEDIRALFEANGLRWRTLDVVTQVIDETFAQHVERISKRALSSFEFLSDQEFEVGLAAMRQAATSEPPGPVTEDIDLLVFERP